MRNTQEGVAAGGAAVASGSKQSSQHYRDWPNDAGFNASFESRAPIDTHVTGTFPSWSAGTLVRAGPGARTVDRLKPENGKFSCDHWFDGFAHLHKFEILSPSAGTSGKVLYQSRSHMDKAIEEARRTGKLHGITFAQKRDPCDTLYKKFKTSFSSTKTGEKCEENLGVVIQPSVHPRPQFTEQSGRKPKTLAVCTDNSNLKEFDLRTLEPMELATQQNLHPKLTGPLSGAHACIDPETGEVFNYNLEMGPRSTYRVFGTSPATGATRILATISDSKVRGSYIHSFFITEHYLVLCVWPAYYASLGISILMKRNILEAIEPFDKRNKCTWLVIDKIGERGLVKRFQSPAMFSFHTVNAFEETQPDGTVDITAELCVFDNLDILHRFYYDNLMSNGSGVHKYCGNDSTVDTKVKLSRFKLSNIEASAHSGTPEAELVSSIPSPQAGDLPIINPLYRTRKHRYVYSLIDQGHSSFLDSIGKTDTDTKTAVLWMEEKCTPGEPIFIPNPEGTTEDDGALLSVVLDGRTSKSYLLCLDARDLTEIARATCDVAIGIGFHGTFIADV